MQAKFARRRGPNQQAKIKAGSDACDKEETTQLSSGEEGTKWNGFGEKMGVFGICPATLNVPQFLRENDEEPAGKNACCEMDSHVGIDTELEVFVRCDSHEKLRSCIRTMGRCDSRFR